MRTVPRSKPFSLEIIVAPITSRMSATSPSGICAPFDAVTSTRLRVSGSSPKIASVANPYGQTLPSVNHGREILAPYGGFDDILYFANVDAVASSSFAVGLDFKIGSARNPLGIEINRTRNLMQNSFDLFRLLFDGREIAAENLDPDLRANSGREHVDPVANGLSPDVRHSRHTELFIKTLQNRLLGRSRRPLILGLEHNDRFGHVHGCRVNGAFGSPDLSDHTRDQRVLSDDFVLPAQNLSCLRERDAWIGDRHEERGLFVQRRHEL